MDFFHSCEEIAEQIEVAIGKLVGNASSGKYIRMGADGTPTKLIDQVAEDVVIDFLGAQSLCNRLISEERGILELGSGDGIIYLDPIDGTHNAITGIPFYAVSIAYAKDGVVEKGYVKDLAHGDVFSATRGKGARLNNETIHVSSTALLDESTMSVYGRKFNPATVLRLGRKIRRWRLLGASALELCYVGCGRLDGFIDVRGTLRVTDAMAGMLICEESGGTVSDNTGRILRFPESVTVGKCLVATNSILHRKVIEYLQE